MELNEKEQALMDLGEEINIVLSIKNNISEEEINNLKEEFLILTEKEIREQISEVTGDLTYIENYREEAYIEPPENIDDKIELVVEEQKICNQIGEDEAEIIVENNQPYEKETSQDNSKAENISVIKEEVKYNQLCIEWDWPVGVNKVLVSYRNDKFPLKSEDKDSNKFVVEKRSEDKFGEFIINKLKDENYYFWVFPIIIENDKTKYLEGKKRLVVNKAIVDIYYELKVKKSFLGAIKGIKILLRCKEKEVNLPTTVLVAKKGGVPIFKADGEQVYSFDYIKINKDVPVEFELPIDKLSKNTYVKLFVEDEKSNSLFRLIPPNKEQLYFK